MSEWADIIQNSQPSIPGVYAKYPELRYVSGKDNSQFKLKNKYTHFKPLGSHIPDTTKKYYGSKKKDTSFRADVPYIAHIKSSDSNGKDKYPRDDIHDANETSSLLGWLAEDGKLVKEVCLDGKEVRDGRWHYIMANRSVFLDGKYVWDGRWYNIMANRSVLLAENISEMEGGIISWQTDQSGMKGGIT